MKKIVFFIFILALSGCTFLNTENTTNFHALLIGINNYYDDHINDLSCCINDVLGIKSALIDHGWMESEITLLTDDTSNPAPNKDNIIIELKNIVSNAGEDDFILISYSGHGTYIEDRDGDEIDGYDEAIVPINYDYNTGDNIILDDELRDIFLNCKTNKGIFILDSCYSGGFINKDLIDTGVTYRYIANKATDGINTDGDLELFDFPVMTASNQVETSAEVNYLEHGIFSYFLIEGFFNLNADKNNDNHLTVRELFNYAEINTVFYTGSQHPQFRYPWDFVDIVITR